MSFAGTRSHKGGLDGYGGELEEASFVYTPTARSTYRYLEESKHMREVATRYETPSRTSNPLGDIGGVMGSGSYASGIASSGEIRKYPSHGSDEATSGGVMKGRYVDGLLRQRNWYQFLVSLNDNRGYVLQVDEGEASWISPLVVRRLRIPCVDGIARVIISQKNFEEEVVCKVGPLEGCDIMLGTPWLLNRYFKFDGSIGAYRVKAQGKLQVLFPREKEVQASKPTAIRTSEIPLRRLPTNGEVQSRSPTNTRRDGTSARNGLAIVNEVSPKPQASILGGSPTKKKEEASSDETSSPRFRVDVKSPPTPAMGILGPRPNSPEFERQKKERSKGATGDNSRAEKGELVMSDVSELSPPEITPELKRKLREKKEGKRIDMSEDTPYSNIYSLAFPSTCATSCVGILGGKPMEPQPCTERERQGEDDLQCELQVEGTTLDASSATSEQCGHSKVKKMILHATSLALVDLGLISHGYSSTRRNSSMMDGVASFSSMSSSMPVNKVRDAMPQATPSRSSNIVGQLEDMEPARRKLSSPMENELVRTHQGDCQSPVSSHLLSAEKALPQATLPSSSDIVGQLEPARRRLSSAIENELVRIPQADFRSSVSSHLLSAEKATPPRSSDTVGQFEGMTPGRRELFSAVKNELVRTPQADSPSPVSSHLLSAEQALPQETPPRSTDVAGQSEDMVPARRKISSAMENELAVPQETPPRSSDIAEQSKNTAPARRKICSAVENELVRTPQADCQSRVVNLSAEKDQPQESIPVPNQNPMPAATIKDVNSTFHKVESFLKAIPGDFLLSLCGTPISNLESAKEIVKHFVGGPLKMLADSANEKAMKEAISLLNENLSSFTDEQARLLVKIKHIFPSMIQDLRDSTLTESSCQDFFTELEKERNTLDDLRNSDMELKLRYDEKEVEEREMETMLNFIRNRKAEILAKRNALSAKADEVMTSAEEKAGKIESTKQLLVNAKDKIDSLKRQWSTLKPLHL